MNEIITYTSYKPSGIDWLGEIPSHWDIIKTSYVFGTIGSGTTPMAGSDEYYKNGSVNWLQTGDLNDGMILKTSKKVTDFAVQDRNLKLYPKGSLVIAMYGATIAKLGLLDIDTTVNQACCVLSSPNKINIKFAFYFFTSAKSQLISLASGGGQPNISQATIMHFRMTVPPLAEQEAIAAYLDEKTAKIDALTAEKQAQVEDLRKYRSSLITEVVTRGLNPDAPLRPSGIEWIGEIPDHWKIVSGRYCAEFTYGFPADSSKFTNERNGIPLIRIRDIYGQDTEVYYEGEDYPHSCLINPDDILIGMDGDFNVSRWQGPQALLNQRVCKFQYSKQLIDRYAYHYLPLALKIINDTKYATTVKHLSAQDLSDMRFLIPPLSEQEKIAAYLDEKTAKIDETIAELKEQLKELDEYKKAVITEAVTGKVDVRDWIPKE